MSMLHKLGIHVTLSIGVTLLKLVWTPQISQKRKSRLKLNFDGASKDNPGLSAAGCILRSSDVHVIWAIAASLGHGSNTFAEAPYLTQALRKIRLLFITS